MQEKTIKSVLNKKLNAWCASITDDPTLVRLIKRDAICTGGAIPSLLTNADVNDYDFYFTTYETTLAVAEYYLKKFTENPPSKFKNSNRDVAIYIDKDIKDRVKIVVRSQGIASANGTKDYKYFEMPGFDPSEPQEFVENVANSVEKEKEGESNLTKFRPIFLTTNAITLSDKVQIIVRFFGSPNDIHENFDFIHCTCFWAAQTNELVLPQEALVCLINKRLKYKQSKYPICSIIRTRKFLKQGWSIDAGQYVKMVWDVNKLDLHSIHVLEDQLVGVDSAYFHEVIQLLTNRQEEGKQIDDAYLIQVIDQVF